MIERTLVQLGSGRLRSQGTDGIIIFDQEQARRCRCEPSNDECVLRDPDFELIFAQVPPDHRESGNDDLGRLNLREFNAGYWASEREGIRRHTPRDEDREKTYGPPQ